MTQLWINGANTRRLYVWNLRKFYKVKQLRVERANWLEEDAAPWFDCTLTEDWSSDSIESIDLTQKNIGRNDVWDHSIGCKLPDVDQMAKDKTLCVGELMAPKKLGGGKKERKNK
tara:strand:+ start:79 stop:423 length:345 start_codon:yes stop_codon:yes gene_type:complete